MRRETGPNLLIVAAVLSLTGASGCGADTATPAAQLPQAPVVSTVATPIPGALPVAGSGLAMPPTAAPPVTTPLPQPIAGSSAPRTLPPIAPSSALGWCDVQSIFTTHCSQCHGATPMYGAPMSLLTSADLSAPSKSDPTKKVYERVAVRIHDVQKPMPPTSAKPALDDAARAMLDAWIAAGAPRGAAESCTPITTGGGAMGTAGGGAPVVTPVNTGELDADGWPVDCGERYKFLSHGTGNAKYTVPAGQPPYVNLSIPAPWGSGDKQALRFKPLVDNAKVLHHFILYGSDGSFVYGWAPGDPGVTMPDGVGLLMPAGNYRLEIHYNNQTGSSQMDGSGVEMCVAKTPRPNDAAVHWLGSLAISVPAHGMQTLNSTCRPSLPKGSAHLISVSPHMHRTGVHAKMVLNRASGETVVLHDAPFDFDNQNKYMLPEDGSAPDVEVRTGDTITSTCMFSNETSSAVRFGQNTENEMCFFFTIAWPIGQLVNGSRSPDGGSPHSCM